jgi:hypothetical protein
MSFSCRGRVCNKLWDYKNPLEAISPGEKACLSYTFVSKCKCGTFGIELLLMQYGRTEWIKNNLNPSFTKTFQIDYRFEEVQQLRFSVFDIDNSTSSLDDDDFLGSIECTLGAVCGCLGYEEYVGIWARSLWEEYVGIWVTLGGVCGYRVTLGGVCGYRVTLGGVGYLGRSMGCFGRLYGEEYLGIWSHFRRSMWVSGLLWEII